MTLEDDGDHRVEGSLQHQIREAAEIMTRLMPKWRQLAQSGLFEPTHRIPQAAWLEGLANAVTHRSYSMMGDHIRVEIYPNRLEIYSPGRFPGITDPTKPLQISRYARNPRIARVLSDMGITRDVAFWMHETFVPLDIIFISEDGRVASVAHGASPQSDARIPSRSPVRFVLELPTPEAKRIGLSVGDRIRHPAIDAVTGQ